MRQRDCSLGVAVTARGEPGGLGQDSIQLVKGRGKGGEGTGSSSSPRTPDPSSSPEEALAAGAQTRRPGKGGRAATALSAREGRSSVPRGRGGGETARSEGRRQRGGRKARGAESGGEGELEKGGSGDPQTR